MPFLIFGQEWWFLIEFNLPCSPLRDEQGLDKFRLHYMLASSTLQRDFIF